MKSFLFRLAKFLFGKSTTSAMPRYMIFIIDVILIIVAGAFVIFVRYFPDFHNLPFIVLLKRSSIMLVLFTISFMISGSYKGMIRYTGFQDILKIIKVTTWVFIISCIIKLIVNHIEALRWLMEYFPSYPTMLLICAVSIFFLVIPRFIIRRIYNEYFRPHLKIVNAVIYGAGDAGIITLNVISQDTSKQYDVICFADDADGKIGKYINGMPIYKPAQIFNKDFIKKNKIDTVILAMPNLNIEDKKKIINSLVDMGLNVKSVPHIKLWVNNKIEVNQIEDIKIEDLLEREPIKLGNENVIRELDGKVVLVTGAAGSIGSEICRQVIQYNPRMLVMLDQAESPMYDLQYELNNEEPYKHIAVPTSFIVGNVKDASKMEKVFEKYKPQIVYHAAAYKHVPLMESFPYEAVYVNVFGTKTIADLAIKYGVEKFVMISTDKAVNPTNVMGATKRIAEIYTQSRDSATKFVTTRFGNVLGSNGSVIPLFKKQLAHGGPLTVTSRDIIRYFMTIPEACSLVLEAGSIGEDDDIFVFDMGKPVKIYDLANNMIKLSHIPNVQIEITGLRPGEKLYEELLATKENTIPTEHPKIMRAKVRKYTEEETNAEIEMLNKALLTTDDFRIVAQMKKIVPEFKSNNSVFQVLDSKNGEADTAKAPSNH